MRIIFAGTAIALFSLATATPAFAQYGGSPQQQVDGTPANRDAQQVAPDQDDEDDQAVMPDDQDANGEISVRADGNDKPGADQGEDYADQGDADVDADQGYDDGEVDQGDVDDDADEAAAARDAEQAQLVGRGDPAQTWQGEDGRSYCRRSDGTTGLVVGGGAGALVGRGIDGGRHRGAGTIIGGVIGALVGTAVERSANQQSCR